MRKKEGQEQSVYPWILDKDGAAVDLFYGLLYKTYFRTAILKGKFFAISTAMRGYLLSYVGSTGTICMESHRKTGTTGRPDRPGIKQNDRRILRQQAKRTEFATEFAA